MHDGYCYFTTDDGQFYIDYLEDPNDSTSLRRRPISGPGSSVEYIVGTQNTSTNVWTGVTKDPQLYTGKTIVYYLPYANTTGNNATLTLTFTNPTGSATSGAKPVYYTGGTRAVNHYAAGSIILLTYDGSSWRRADYNANTNTFVTQEASITDSWRKVLLHYTTNSAGGNVPSTVTNQVYAAKGIEVQPSTGTLAATKFKGPLEGNADTATAFSSAADVTLTGDVTGTASSTKDWSIATTLAASGVTAGSYGPSANATPTYGATFDVPQITVDEKGRVTSASTKTVTIPASDNIDTKVTQGSSSTASWRKVLLNGGSNDTYSTWNADVNVKTDSVYQSKSVAVQPSTGTLQATALQAGTYNNSIKMREIQAWPDNKYGPYEEGWKRVCALSGYNGYGVGTVYINGKWQNEEPTLAALEIVIRSNTSARIKQIAGATATSPDKVRVVFSGTNGKWYFDIHMPARATSDSTGARYVTFVGRLTVSEVDETTNFLTEEPTTTTVTRTLIVTNDQPSITVNLGSTTAGLFTGANMTTGVSGTLPITNGGTGATTAAGARTNLGLGTMAVETASDYIPKSIGTAAGDIIYWSASGTPIRLAKGSDGQVLKLLSGIPSWGTDEDTKVTQNAVDSTVNKDYRIILSYDANDTDAVTNTVNKNTNLRYNPSTNKLSTGNLQLTGTLTVTGQTTLNDNLNAQGVTATNLLVNGAANFVQSPTAPTPASGDSSVKLATTEFVTSAVQDLAGPMRFIGTLGSGGTITTLPAAAESNKGHTYKVIAKGTYQGIYGEVGDLMISNGTAWINVRSGDVPDGTITNIATGSGLTGGPITTTGTISHADTSSQTSITANGRTYITGVTLDDFGHVTELSTGTETVTDTTYTISTGDDNGQIKVTPSSGSAYNVNVKGLGGQSITDGTAKYLAYYSDAHTISATPNAHFNWSNLNGTTKGREELVLGDKSNRFGCLALYGKADASGGAYIVANSPIVWQTHTLPDTSGWIVTAGDGSSTGAGGARRPVYVSTSGVATAGAVTFDTLNANRLMWTNAADKVYAGYHYADSTHIAVNSYSLPSYNFYVSGTAGFNIGTSDTTSSKKIVILGNNRYLAVGAAGLQAYTGATSASTTEVLCFQYNGGNVKFGQSTSIKSNIIVNGDIMPGATASYGLGSLDVGWRTLYLKGASGYSGIQYVMSADSSTASAIVCLRDTSKTMIGQIGYHNTGDTNGAIYIIPHNSVTGDAWNGKNGLYIGKNNLKWEDKYILRYSETATTGQVIISDDTSGNVKTSGFTIATSVPANAVFTDTTYTFNTTAQTNKVQYKVTGESNWTDIPIDTVAVQIVRW